MPIQHSPPTRQTRSQARTQAVLTPTPRDPLDATPAELHGPGEDGEEEEENYVEEEESYGMEGVPAPVGASQGTGGPTLAQSNQSEPSLLAIMQQMNQIIANLQPASSSEASRPPAFNTPSMKAPGCFHGTQPFKVRNRKKVLYATSFLICRAAKWIEPYLSNLTNQDPNYLLNSWELFESQLFT
ncbi:hypothetical protein O181_127391 [Austropuccinia psidii MF-1]|uniref:Uncharacterized protein n=1 Tax=Austropuccinia psidii MF-1 TaxID=1389203 RepID=A0A9Q3Q6S5_9BASI|nr:hypothetical protein [Austropuccinia psidii MF-1]